MSVRANHRDGFDLLRIQRRDAAVVLEKSDRLAGSLQRQPTFGLAVTGNGPGALAGPLEAYACQPCGYVEFYLKEPLVADGVNVVQLPAGS